MTAANGLLAGEIRWTSSAALTARPVEGQDDIARTGTIFANGETQIGTQIAAAMESVGIALVRRALNAPLIRIADNAGCDGTFVIGKEQEAQVHDIAPSSVPWRRKPDGCV